MEGLATAAGIYVGLLVSTYLATTIIILTKQSWGPLPHLYIRLIKYFQDRLWINKCLDVENNNSLGICLGRKHLTPDFTKTEHLQSPFVMSTHLLKSGIESVLEDDISRPFLAAPERGWWMLSIPPYNDKMRIQYELWAIYGLGLLFRWGFLFPLRILFLVTSLIWIICCGIVCAVLPVPQYIALYFAITFGRLSNASIGLVTRVHDKHNRPNAPGIAVANHMTANDIMIIYSDCDYDGPGYTVTGQSHGGFIETLQRFGSPLSPTLWLDREDTSQRNSFQTKVLDYSSNSSVYPVLLFPEGYCSNNETVLQFRKAVFTGKVPIYPIAMRQNSRVGDAFWREDTYIPYMIRIMTSFAIHYDIRYLAAMIKRPNEDSAQFAFRVQCSIANSVGIDSLPYDGGLKKTKERTKYREKIRNTIGTTLCSVVDQ